MWDTATKKLAAIATHAGENHRLASILFAMANAATASEVDAAVTLQSMGVMLAVKGYAEHVRADGFPPLHELMATFKKLGGWLLVCAQTSRQGTSPRLTWTLGRR